ncbi:MAG: MurR/RpiR family transcriptional regulator [Woeseiaceae bacterium]
MSCLAIIRSARDKMSANEKKLADFILDNASLIRDYSSQQIAAAVGVSQSSVVKFSQKIGYKGFTDLKLAIHESVVKQESNVAVLDGARTRAGSRVSLKDQLFQAKTEAISGATTLNEDKAIRDAARALESCQRLQLVGSGNAFTVARDAAFRMMSLGKSVIAEGDSEVQLSVVETLGKDDCLFIISSLGQSPHLVQLAKRASKGGATVITLTNQVANPVAALANIRLYSISSGSDREIPDVIAVTSQQHVTDLVFYTIAAGAGLPLRKDPAGLTNAR